MKLRKLFLTAVAAAAMCGAVYVQDINVSLNGNIVSFPNQKPVVVEGRTLIPLRGVFDNMGYSIDWNGETKTVTLAKGSDTITISIGQASYSLNGEAHAIDVPAQIINGSTMLPLRAIADATGAEVLWDGETKIATILDQSNVSTEPISGTVITNSQSEADFVNNFTSINQKFNETATSFLALAGNPDSFKDIKVIAEQSQAMYDAAIAAKDSLNALPAPDKYADLKAKSVDYMQGVADLAKIMADVANGNMTLDEFNSKLNSIGTEVALKEAAYQAAAKAVLNQ